MHEVSIVNSIVRTLEMEFEEAKLERMKTIHLKVGILSNIEPRLLYNAYQAYNHPGSKYHQVALNIESVPISISCDFCGHVTKVQQYKFSCEKCGRPSKNILTGEEMLIHKVEFED